MKKLLALLNDRARITELILYVFFGVLTTLINLVCYWAFRNLLGIQYQVSSVLAWIVAVLFAFVVNKLVVFRSKSMERDLLLREASSFFGARLMSLILFDVAGLWLCVDVFGMDDIFAKLVMNVMVVIFNYIASKLVIFQKKQDKQEV